MNCPHGPACDGTTLVHIFADSCAATVAAEAGSHLWDVAVATGHADALGTLDAAGSARLASARQDALSAGLTQKHVDHATMLGLEWGRDNASCEAQNRP